MSLVWIAVLFLTCEPLRTNSQGLFNCRSRNTTVLQANKHAEVDITHPDCIRLTWERVKSGNRLIITSTKDVNITTTRTKKLEIHASAKCGGTASSASLEKASMLIWILSIFAVHKFGVLNSVTIFLMLLLYFSSTSISTFEECSSPRVHIKIPTSFVSKVCINSNRCINTSCDLGLYLDDSNNKGYSILDSDNEVLFRKNTCEIIKPKYWDDWIYLHLGINDTSGGLLYYADSDGDGLVNILEYYANKNVTEPLMPNKNRRSTSFHNFLKNIGSNPKNPDSDHDLLLDGYEFINNLSPVVQDDSNEDLDGDLLSNLNEQIQQTDPLNSDTDGDGVNDGTEINNHADPTDPSDQGRGDYSDSFVIMRLVVGDPSGSHSERYNLNVGDISHQSPGFGLVGSGEYKFLPGTYTITVKWIATNMRSGIPDYDYTASVQTVTSKNVDVQVKDDGSILGTYYDSSFDRTVGKKSRLIIKSKCQNNEAACYKDCESCESSLSRVWDPIRQVCKSRGSRFQSGCPCADTASLKTKRTTGEKGLNIIKHYEGLRLHAYQDSGGKWTIGYGHTKDVKEGDIVDEIKADEYLRQDVREAEQAVNGQVLVYLTQDQFDALISWTFNLGSGTLRNSTMLSKLNAGKCSQVPCEMIKWIYVRKTKYQGLVNRRKKEAALFIGGNFSCN